MIITVSVYNSNMFSSSQPFMCRTQGDGCFVAVLKIYSAMENSVSRFSGKGQSGYLVKEALRTVNCLNNFTARTTVNPFGARSIFLQ